MAVVDIAVAVGSAVGLEGTAAAIGGGALLGAGAGGLYGAVTGDGSIGHDMLMGGLLGGGIAYGSGALGFGSDATDAMFGVGSGGAGAGTSGIAGSTGVTGPGNTVAGAVGAGPAPTAYTPTMNPEAVGGLPPQSVNPEAITSYSTTPTTGMVNPEAVGSTTGAASSTAPSSLAKGMASATAFMKEHPIMTGLGLYTAASMAGLGKQPAVSLPAGAAPSNMDLSLIHI